MTSRQTLANKAGVARKTGVVHGFGQMFCAAAGTHVEAVNTVTSFKRLLRKTGDVASIGRTFQAMQKNDLAACFGSGLMFVGDNSIAIIDGVFHSTRGETHQIDFTRPEIPGNREQVPMANERLEGVGQVRF